MPSENQASPISVNPCSDQKNLWQYQNNIKQKMYFHRTVCFHRTFYEHGMGESVFTCYYKLLIGNICALCMQQKVSIQSPHRFLTNMRMLADKICEEGCSLVIYFIIHYFLNGFVWELSGDGRSHDEGCWKRSR